MTPEIRGFVLRFSFQGGIAYPVDGELHKLAVEFAEKYLDSPVNLSVYETVLVAAEVDDQGKPIKVVGMNCRVPRWDYAVWRFITEEAGNVLIERTRGMLDDAGLRGGEIFVLVAEGKPENRCPNWKDFLKKVGAENASRWKVKV